MIAPATIIVRGVRPKRGMIPHCAASVAEAPAIMTIEMGISEPLGGSASRSMMKKPRQVSVAAWAWPATIPAVIQRAMRGSRHFMRRPRGWVAATTLAPVALVASEG